ncbi:hypothetical protein CHUAL_008316 [Chamberlinius hualienensis]
MDKKHLSFAVICIFICISSVSSQCCDFENSDCVWQGNWHLAPDELPDTSYYPNFTTTQPSQNYVFIEDQAGNETCTKPLYVESPTTLISFDYFIGNLNTQYQNELQVHLQNADTKNGIVSIFMSNFDNAWKRHEFSCADMSVICCINGYPCNIEIEFMTYLNMMGTGLYGIDNVGFCN